MSDLRGEIQVHDQGGNLVELKNSILLDYLLWDFAWNFENADMNERIEATFPRFRDRPDILFAIEKLSATEFGIEIRRIDKDEQDKVHDEGYFFEFVVTLFGYKGPLKRRIMDFETEFVTIKYNYNDLGETQREGNYFVLKCVAKMHEITLLHNDARNLQDELLEKMIDKDKYRNKLADMAYLLKRDGLTNIFSGRQDFSYALEKAGLIERTLPFADDIAERKRAKEKGIEYQTGTSPAIYLNYILTRCLSRINKYEVPKLYLIANHFGLPYLIDECRDFMLDNLDNDFVVHVLLYADMAMDLQLTHLALDAFIPNRNEVMATEAWSNAEQECRLYVQNIVDSAIRKLKHELKHDMAELKRRLQEREVDKAEPVGKETEKEENKVESVNKNDENKEESADKNEGNKIECKDENRESISEGNVESKEESTKTKEIS